MMAMQKKSKPSQANKEIKATQAKRRKQAQH